MVAGAVGAPRTIERPTVSCGYYLYWSGVPVDGAILYFRRRRTIIVLPTNWGLTRIVVLAPLAEFPQYRADIEGTSLAGIDLVPPLAARVRAGRRPIEEGLAHYERRRDEAALPEFESTVQRAALEPPPPEMQQLFATLRGNQGQINRFIGLDAGTVRIPQFFSQENVQCIVQRAARA